jgi:hypothetical protein
VTRLNVHRFTVLAIGAVAALVAGLAATPASAASGGVHTATPKAPAAVAPCEPASMMTPQQRATLTGSWRACGAKASIATAGVQPDAGTKSGTVNENSPVADFNANYQFFTKTTGQLTNAALRDVSCDGRSVYTDVWDENGWMGWEYINTMGCNKTQSGYPVVHLNEPDGPYLRFIYVKTYACNSTSCSHVYPSSNYYNPYAT